MPKFCLAIVCLSAAMAALAHAETAPDGIVVIVSIDGLAHYYLDDPSAPIPTLKAIIAEGTRAMMRPAMPTVTWPNHTSIITGDEPARHGVVSNHYLDRQTGKVVTLLTDPDLDKDRIVKVPTLYDAAKEAGLTTASVCWPASRRARTLDWTVPDVASEKLWESCATPGLMSECTQAGIPFQTYGDLTRTQETGKRDKLATDIFTLILRKHHPRLALLHIANVDHVQHQHGPQTPQAYNAIEGADADIGAVWDELKHDFPGKATLLIVSDHGFFPYRRIIFPNVVLRDAGLVEVKGPRVVGGAVRVLPEGGAALIYVMQPGDRAAVIDRVAAALKPIEGIGKIIEPKDFKAYGIADPSADPHAPDLVISAAKGYVFGNVAEGSLSVTAPLTSDFGAHGYDREEEAMHAIFIGWGVGIKPDAQLGVIHNTDVAPTAAKLLGLTMKNVDGRVLEEILTK